MSELVERLRKFPKYAPLHHEAADELERLEGEIDNAKMRTALLEATFKHTHQANYVDGSLVDDCAECGLDIRDPIHLRWQGGDT